MRVRARLEALGLPVLVLQADTLAEMQAATETLARALGTPGGERQRVLIALALAVNAPVLLLDEPTSHLDVPHQRALVASLAARSRAGAAVAAVLHDLTLTLAADRVLVMAASRLRADGPPADAAVRAAIVDVFDSAVTIERVAAAGGERWVALPVVATR